MRFGPGLPEVELAEPSSKRSLYLTIFAASMTVMVVAVVLAGPSLIACSQSAEGMGACLRQHVVEAGLLPPDQVETVIADPQAEPQELEPQAPAADPEPGLPAAESASEPAVAAAAPPELTLLRAGPDGSLVIAGTGSPGARIEVFANGEPLGTTTAGPSGDWVVVPEAPLAPGGVEISVGEAGSGTLGEQSFVVVIDPDRTAEPLVVATRPGEASAVLQGLPQPEPAPADVSSAPEPDPAAPEPEPAVEPSPQVAAVEPQAEIEPEAPSRSTAEPPATVEPAPAVEPAPVAEPEAPDASVATVDPEVTEPEPAPVVITPPSIDAIEIDGSANFFAGGGSEGATVRLYVDDRFVADATVAGGRWLVETANVLTQPAQRVRVDMLKPGTAEVAARAEVNFVVELPVAAPEPPPAAVKPTTPEPEPAPSVEVAEPASPPPSEPAIVAQPSDRALDPGADAAAPPPPARDLTATPDAAPAEPVRDRTAATEAQPSQPADRDLGAAEKPASEVAALPDLAQPHKVAVPPEDKALETADVPDAALGTPRPEPLVPPGRPAPELEAEPQLAAPAPVIPVPEPGPAVPMPEPVPEIAAAPEPEPEAAPAGPAKPAAPAIEARPTTPATTTAVPAKPAAPDAPEPATTTAAAPPGEDTIPTLRAVPVGDPEAMRFASGKAIIRRGDNLWSIARRVYGTGLKYTTIYRANDDQIRNPHLIYPGQVFDLPPARDE